MLLNVNAFPQNGKHLELLAKYIVTKALVELREAI